MLFYPLGFQSIAPYLHDSELYAQYVVFTTCYKAQISETAVTQMAQTYCTYSPSIYQHQGCKVRRHI